ncbi:MAG: transketolase family protein [Acidobacteria bacterium]|nr:transketolase family protein [Acidobacteriota bacterium]MBI3470021.1 transketolase family protein [Candidatus Solibacter usitatus]
MTPSKTRFELKSGLATREAFGRTLTALGRENQDVVVCDADLSKSTFTSLFAKEFPERFFSCGIAEANMISIGAGLAAGGKIPFVSSFSCFAVNKGFEQLRVTVAYPGVNLKLVGTHSGISIGEDGPSQMSIEDLGLMCSLPGFVVLSPADEVSMAALVRAAAAHVGPVFIRAGRMKAPVIYPRDQVFTVGHAVELIEGTDVTIIATGLLVAEAIRAADALEAEGVSARVVDIHTIKPLDREAIARAAQETAAIVVAEEHLIDGGLGVRVAQVVAETCPCVMEFVGIRNTYAESASPEQLLDKYGLVSRDVIAAVRRALARKG